MSTRLTKLGQEFKRAREAVVSKKEEGDKLFNEGCYEKALDTYQSGMAVTIAASFERLKAGVGLKALNEHTDMKIEMRLNCVECYVKLERWMEAIEAAETVLQAFPLGSCRPRYVVSVVISLGFSIRKQCLNLTFPNENVHYEFWYKKMRFALRFMWEEFDTARNSGGGNPLTVTLHKCMTDLRNQGTFISLVEWTRREAWQNFLVGPAAPALEITPDGIRKIGIDITRVHLVWHEHFQVLLASMVGLPLALIFGDANGGVSKYEWLQELLLDPMTLTPTLNSDQLNHISVIYRMDGREVTEKELRKLGEYCKEICLEDTAICDETFRGDDHELEKKRSTGKLGYSTMKSRMQFWARACSPAAVKELLGLDYTKTFLAHDDVRDSLLCAYCGSSPHIMRNAEPIWMNRHWRSFVTELEQRGVRIRTDGINKDPGREQVDRQSGSSNSVRAAAGLCEAGCGQGGTLACGWCKAHDIVTRYCSRDCQRKHWKLGHKNACPGKKG